MRFVIELLSLINEKIKTTTEAISADKEEYLKPKAIINQVIKKMKPCQYDIASNIPINTAIPFPPLNLSHIGKICPKKIAKENKVNRLELKCKRIFIGINDFKISKMRVVSPNFHPFSLAMLVAPILFEPLTLGSVLLKK